MADQAHAHSADVHRLKPAERNILALESPIVDLAAWGFILEMLLDDAEQEDSAERESASVFAQRSLAAAARELRRTYYTQVDGMPRT